MSEFNEHHLFAIFTYESSKKKLKTVCFKVLDVQKLIFSGTVVVCFGPKRPTFYFVSHLVLLGSQFHRYSIYLALSGNVQAF